MYKEKITELLLSTNREGMDKLVEHMEEGGFFTAPCSTRYHLSKEGGLAEHSLNVYENALRISGGLGRPEEVLRDSLIIVSLLHDLGKMGQFGKENYVPNMLKGRATKVNSDPEPKQSEAQPYKSNPDLLYVDHEVRSIAIASRFIELAEEEQLAILWHNGLYGPFKYEIQGNETPLYMILHFADLWSARVTGLSYSNPLTWPSNAHGEVTVDGGNITYTPKSGNTTSNLMTREYDWIAIE